MRNKYTTLLFDADGTLFDYDRAEREALLNTFKHFSVPHDEDEIVTGYRLINNELWRQFESGMISLPELRAERFARLFKSLGLDLDPHKFGEIYILKLGECSVLLPTAIELLEELKGKYRMALVTNGIAVVQRRRIKKAGLDRYFRLIVISEEIGYPKPDPLFFDITLKKLDNPDKDEVLIIGDSLTSDIAGGNLSGIDTCWFNPESKDNEGEFQSTYSIKKLLDLLTLL